MAEYRKSNFIEDNKIGKIGENDLMKFLSTSTKLEHFEDVSDVPIFQIIDIDFIQFNSLKENGEPYTIKDVENTILSHSKENKYFISYEVKTDTRSEETRNVVYELISHNGPGCCAITRANYIYYVFLDNTTREIKERWLIKTKEWRDWIRTNSEISLMSNKEQNAEKLLNKIKEKLKKVRLHNFERTNDNVLNFLCNIEELEKAGVAQKIITTF